MLPQISVIIPAYNRAHCISRAIQSVLAQTVPAAQILVIDDGSTDGTAELIRSSFGSSVQLLSHITNSGAAAARNTGMQAASGDYIAWLDSDDQWLPEKLEQQLAALSSNPMLAAVCSAFKYVDRNGRETIHIPKDRSPWASGLLFGCDIAPGTTLLVRRDAALAIGPLDTRLPRYEDWDWLLRFTIKYELGLTTTPLAKVHRESRPSVKIVKISVDYFIDKYQREFGTLGIIGSRRALSRMWLDVAWAYKISEHNYDLAKKYFWKAICITPLQGPGVYAAFINSIYLSLFSGSRPKIS